MAWPRHLNILVWLKEIGMKRALGFALVLAYGSGVRALPEGGIACEPREGVVRTIHALFSGK